MVPFGRLETPNEIAKAVLLRAKLPDGTQPIFHVEGFRDLAVLDRLYVDRHDPETLARMRHPK